MIPLDEQIEFVRYVTTKLESAGIPYMLTGSIVLTLHEIPRTTRDVDIVAEIGAQDADKLIEMFEPDCYIDRQAILEAVATEGMFNIIHYEFAFQADFIIRKGTEYRQKEFARKQRVSLHDVDIWAVSPEDLILSKLDWARMSDSTLQKRDVAGLIESLPDLDWAYLETWADKLELMGLLNEVRNDA